MEIKSNVSIWNILIYRKYDNHVIKKEILIAKNQFMLNIVQIISLCKLTLTYGRKELNILKLKKKNKKRKIYFDNDISQVIFLMQNMLSH